MKPKNALQLALAALIWGVAFAAQSSASQYISPFSYNALRCFLGGLTLLPLVLYKKKREQQARSTAGGRRLFIGGICCGLCLCLGSVLQQMGIERTSVGKAGFVTALYIIFVPIVSAVFLRKKIAPTIIVSAALGLLGMFLLCMREGFSMGTGDLLILLCSFAFTAHILVIDAFTASVDGVLLSCIQFFVVALICLPFMLAVEQPSLAQIHAARLPLFYSGVMSCGAGYTLQIIGQKDMNPTAASLILSLESVFSAIAGWIILGQALSFREICGCAVMFMAILLATAGDAAVQKLRRRRQKAS